RSTTAANAIRSAGVPPAFKSARDARAPGRRILPSLRTRSMCQPIRDRPPSAAALEVLDLALVLFGLGAGLEGAEVAALAGLGIELARIEAVFAGFQLADPCRTATLNLRR